MKFWCVLCFVVLVGGCVSYRGDLGRVVEKSKRTQPVRTRLKPWVFHRLANHYAFVGVKSRVLHLPLGIKQAKLRTMLSAEELVCEKVKEAVSAKFASSKSSDWKNIRAHGAVMREVLSQRSDFSLVDVYYEVSTPSERFSGGEREATVFVLVYVPIELVSHIVSRLKINM